MHNNSKSSSISSSRVSSSKVRHLRERIRPPLPSLLYPDIRTLGLSSVPSRQTRADYLTNIGSLESSSSSKTCLFAQKVSNPYTNLVSSITRTCFPPLAKLNLYGLSTNVPSILDFRYLPSSASTYERWRVSGHTQFSQLIDLHC